MSLRQGARVVVLTGVLLASLAACGSSNQAPEASDISTTSTEKSTLPSTPGPTAGSESAWPGRLAVGGVALVVGLGLGLGLRRRLRRSDTGRGPVQDTTRSASPTHPTGPTVPSPHEPDQALVDGLLALADLADSPAVQAQVRATLQRVGVVEMVAAPGERFDPDRHHAVGTVPTADPGHHMSIARVVRVGWATSEAVIRTADVEVSRHLGRSD